MLYILKSAITLALLYSCFFFLLSKETFHRFNRCMLVGIMLVSLVVPLFHFTTEHPTVINEEFYQMETLMEEDTTPMPVVQTEEHPRITWVQVVEGVYLTGVAVMLLLTLMQALSLLRLMHKGLRHTDTRGNTVVLLKGDIPPFSIFRYIVMSVKDYEIHRQHILTHEQEHIRLGHTYDLLLLEAMKTFQWFNPFVWFISRDLKAVHEYEADQAVIHQGIDAKSYQQLLVMKVVGNRLQPFTNNLNHGSLKKRILMMYQKPSNRWLMLKALCAIPVAALTIAAFATPAETDPVEDFVATLENKEVPVFNQEKSLTTEATPTDASDMPNDSAEEPLIIKDDKEPLIVVDGKIIDVNTSQLGKNVNLMEDEDMFKLLNISRKEDIEEVCVLTGASATTVYGEKAKNGAIVIKTKALRELPLDTVVVHHSAVETKATQNDVPVDSLVKKLPGAEQHEDGSITIDGKSVKKIILEGQEVYNDDDPNEVFLECEKPATYPGGQTALMQLVSQNVRYPEDAQELSITGRVIVSFIIQKDGTCTDFKVVNNNAHDLGGSPVTVTAQRASTNQQDNTGSSSERLMAMKSLEEEALRVLHLMGKWTPAKQRGRTVRMQKTLPITFRLQ